MEGPTLPSRTLQQWCLTSMANQVSLHEQPHSYTTLQPLKALCAYNPSPLLPSAPSPCLLQRTHICLGGSGQQHSLRSGCAGLCLANLLLCSPPRLQSSPSSLAYLHTDEGTSQNAGTFVISSLLDMPGPFWFLSLLSNEVTGRYSWPFKILLPSARNQWAFCKKRSACRYIFDVFMGGDELHILLPHRLDHSLMSLE